MKLALNKQTFAVGMVWILLIGLLSMSFVALGAAQVDRDSGYVANETAVDADGPTTVDVSLEAANDSSLDTDPLEVTTFVVDNSSGEVIDNQTVSLNSTETATQSFDVDRGSYDVETMTANQSRASMLLSADVTTTEDRNSGYEVSNETVEVTNDTETVYADLAVANESSSNVSVTVDLLDSNNSTVAFDTISIEPNSTGSVEFSASDLDLASANYTIEVYTADSSSGDYVNVSDIGTTESSSRLPIIGNPDGSTHGIPNTWLIAGGFVAIVVGATAYSRR